MRTECDDLPCQEQRSKLKDDKVMTMIAIYIDNRGLLSHVHIGMIAYILYNDFDYGDNGQSSNDMMNMLLYRH